MVANFAPYSLESCELADVSAKAMWFCSSVSTDPQSFVTSDRTPGLAAWRLSQQRAGTITSPLKPPWTRSRKRCRARIGASSVLPVQSWDRRRALIWALAVVISVGVLVLAIWAIPLLLTRHPSAGLSAAARLAAENDVRTPVVAALAVVGAAALTAGVTWRATVTALRGQALAEQSQVTDRYTKAIDQLGSDKLDVRVGGIYALERITVDSPRDLGTVMEVLATFIRAHSREQRFVAESAGARVPEHITLPDIQAALSVIGHQAAGYDGRPIDLTGANLAGADLTSALLVRVDFTGTDLAHSNLYGADLSGARLVRANLTGAALSGARLTNADLTHARLTGADLYGADLSGADLSGADLTDARLTDADLTHARLSGARLADARLTRAGLSGADLTGADLTHARLTDARLSGADLTGALWAEESPLPEGWVRDAGSGRFRRANPGSGDSDN